MMYLALIGIQGILTTAGELKFIYPWMVYSMYLPLNDIQGVFTLKVYMMYLALNGIQGIFTTTGN